MLLNIYQHRGLPHAHIVTRMDNHPIDDESKLKFIDDHIQARIPNELCNEVINSKEKENQNKYIDLIKNKMLHKCSHAFPNGCKKDQNSLCKYGYDTITTNNESSFDEKGYPVYYRPKKEDLNVVPHNKEILLD
jgi:hypothetical protein